MSLHPKDARNHLSRREFLLRAGMTGVALPSLGAILAACGGGAQTGVKTGGPSGSAGGNPYGTGGIAGAPYPLARPDAPVTWNTFDDNPPIDSDLPPEKNATLKIFNWQYYLKPKIVKRFEAEFDCKVEVSTFLNFDPGFRKVTSGQVDFDLYFGVYADYLGKLVAGKFIRPLNHDYLPNFDANVWDVYKSPWYDQEARYTVPYGIYSTGIFWRNDLVKIDIAGMDNPYDVFWSPDAPKNKTHLGIGPRDPLAMAMMRKGITDINTGDPAIINQAHDDLLEVVKAVNPKWDHTDYEELPHGAAWLHQSWSGNAMNTIVYFLTPKVGPELFSYWWPPMTDPSIPGAIGNDTLTILSAGKNPVLAHHFLNNLFDPKVALENFATYTGYQPPIKSIVPEQLVARGLVPENLATVVVREEDFSKGVKLGELSLESAALWQEADSKLTAGV